MKDEIALLRNEIAELRSELGIVADLLSNSQLEEKKADDSSDQRKSLDIIITETLYGYGIPPHVKGFRYLKEAIIMELDGEGLRNGITKLVYPTIAKNHGDTPSRVERAIRHAIGIGYKGNAKPTNAQFIAIVSEKLKFDVESA